MHEETNNKDRRIATCIMANPPGNVASYGQIASIAGIPRGHRVVARFVKVQDDYPDLPWHRVIRADGRSGFPIGSSQFNEQSRRLKSEGVILRNSRVDMTRYAWQPELDFLLFHPDL